MKRLLGVLALLISVSAFGQVSPRLSNAQVQTRSAAAGLEKTVKPMVENAKGPTWVGYAVPTQARKRFVCCCTDNHAWQGKNGGCSGGCSLDGDRGSYFNSNNGSCVDDHPQTHVLVFLRAQSGKITQVRVFTPDCALDGKNLPVYWVSDVRETESVSLLLSLARKGDLSAVR